MSYWNGGGWWDGRRPAAGYQLTHRGHWSLDGTGESVSVIGATCEPPLVGYECDGTPYWRRGGAVTAAPGRPHKNIAILGISPLESGWHATSRDPAATMSIYTDRSGAIVFSGGTTDWPIAAGSDPEVAQVTRNLLRYLSIRSVRLTGPGGGLHDGRERLVEGETVTFHIALADLAGDVGEIRWRVGHADDPGEWKVGGITQEVTVGPVGRLSDGERAGDRPRRRGAGIRLQSAGSGRKPRGSHGTAAGEASPRCGPVRASRAAWPCRKARPPTGWRPSSETNAELIAGALHDGSDLLAGLEDEA